LPLDRSVESKLLPLGHVACQWEIMTQGRRS
jgi:hypothetical protein